MRKKTALKIITLLMVSSLMAGMLPFMLPVKGAEGEQRITVQGTGVCGDEKPEDEDPDDHDSVDEDPDDEDPDDHDSVNGDPDDEDPDDEDSGDDAWDHENPDDEDIEDEGLDDENDDRDLDDDSNVIIGAQAAKGAKGQNDEDDDPDGDENPDDEDPDDDNSKADLEDPDDDNSKADLKDPDDDNSKDDLEDPDDDNSDDDLEDPDDADPDDDLKDTADVFVTITWDDKDNQDGIRPDFIRIKLLADGADGGKTCEVDSFAAWSDEFCNLEKYSDEHKIRYSVNVLPDAVITGTDGPGTYDYEIADVKETDDAFECEIIARHTPEVTGFEAAVRWNDDENAENSRPESITFRVRANGEKVGLLTVTKENNWKASFSDLPKYSGGKEIIYTITEDMIKDYTPEITGNMKQGFTIVNHYTPGKTSVCVSKVWKDDQNRFSSRPETVTIRLLADGEDTGETIVLSEENDWAGVFAGVDANAEYTIVEEMEGLSSEDEESGDKNAEDSGSEDTKPGDSDSEDTESGDSDSEDTKPGDSDSEDTESEDSDSEDTEPGDSDSEDMESGDSDSEDMESGDSDSEDTEPEDSDSEDTESGDSEDGESEDEELVEDEDEPGKYDGAAPGKYKAEISGDAIEGFTVTNTFMPDYSYFMKDSGTAAMSGGSGDNDRTDEGDADDVSDSREKERDGSASTEEEISKKTGADTGDENRPLFWGLLMILALAARCIHYFCTSRRGM